MDIWFAKDLIKMKNGQTIYWEEMFENDISDKGIIFRI